MRFLSLFAGIGGFDLGLEMSGMECAGQVEKDKYCTSILEMNWPDVPRWKDIRDVNKYDIGQRCGQIDLICGGFPCQPFSSAGNKKGTDDDRYLWPEMLRIIREVGPDWVFGENVTGIISMALDTVLDDLEGQGYTCRPFVIPACAVGAPHRRDRVWIIGAKESRFLENPQCDGFPEAEVSESSGARVGASSWSFGTEQSTRSGRFSGRSEDVAARRKFYEYRYGPDEPNMDQLAYGLSPEMVAQVSGGDGWGDKPIPRLVEDSPERAARVKALGNAVVPPLVAEIGYHIINADKMFKKETCNEEKR